MTDMTVNGNTVVFAHGTDDDGADVVKPLHVRRLELGMRFYFLQKGDLDIVDDLSGVTVPLVVIDRHRAIHGTSRVRRTRKIEAFDPVRFNVLTLLVRYEDEDDVIVDTEDEAAV